MFVHATRRASRRLAVVAAAAAVAVGSLTTSGAAVEAERSAPAPGASGIGDSYFPTDGNGGYDVRHYAVDVDYAVATGALNGTTTVTAKATQQLSRFNLDLVLDATSVHVDGAPVGFDSGDHELVVTPTAPIAKGATFTVTVEYNGRPGDITHRGNRPWVSSTAETMATNEPQIAPWWFPANDHPRDKATFDIAVSVPSGQQAISNGTFLGTTSEPGWDTWRWRAAEPMAPYLAFFAAGRFEYESGVRRGLPYFNAVSMGLEPGNRARAMELMRRSPDVVRWLEAQLGDYPFSSTGGVTTSLAAGFALENQTRPTYPSLGTYERSLVVHELAHQWFGDSVSVQGWRDIWLNEGFATYMEVRYAETHGGQGARTWLRRSYAAVDQMKQFWKIPIDDPGSKRIFEYPVYQRGGMTLAALRRVIGPADFSRLLRRWVAVHRNGNVTTSQFTALAEEISGEELDPFFDAWLRADHPPARTRANGLD